jgi:putative transposase
MKKKRHSVEAIMRILRESEMSTVSEVSRLHGITEQTLYRWRRKYAGMDMADAKRLKALEEENRRLKALEEENRRLKALVADQALNIAVLKEVNSKNW